MKYIARGTILLQRCLFFVLVLLAGFVFKVGTLLGGFGTVHNEGSKQVLRSIINQVYADTVEDDESGVGKGNTMQCAEG